MKCGVAREPGAHAYEPTEYGDLYCAQCGEPSSHVLHTKDALMSSRRRYSGLIGDMHAHCMSIEPEQVGIAFDGGCLLCKARIALEAVISENERLVEHSKTSAKRGPEPVVPVYQATVSEEPQ